MAKRGTRKNTEGVRFESITLLQAAATTIGILRAWWPGSVGLTIAADGLIRAQAEIDGAERDDAPTRAPQPELAAV